METDLLNILTNIMHFPSNAFAGQVILVTGGGRGIGYQIAKGFGLLGSTVILAEKSSDGQSAESFLQADGIDAHFIRTDVANPESVSALRDMVLSKFGRVDIIVNNAIHIHESAVTEMRVEDWDQTLAVNLRGTFLVCRTFLPGMLKQNEGKIINLVSLDAMPGLSAYIASKQGIVGFTQSLALELEGTEIKVIPFSPGMVDTPGIRSVAAGLAPRLGLTEAQFMGISLHSAYDGMMPAEHAAAATVCLAGQLASEFNGIVVNGYEILERAGVLKSTAMDAPAINHVQPGPLGNQKECFHQFSGVLTETEAEFNQLPVFVRPIAKQGFKNKTGASLSDWQRLAAGLESGETPMPANFHLQLDQLAKYYREVPQETARFTRDEETLKQITALTEERLNLIATLKASIS